MNSFQILDKDNNPIPINELDKQAAEFWNAEFHSKRYASPDKYSPNWYDSIGFNIAYPGKFASGWDGVKIELITTQLQYNTLKCINKESVECDIKVLVAQYQPYFNLIDHWSSLGYQPKQIVQ